MTPRDHFSPLFAVFWDAGHTQPRSERRAGPSDGQRRAGEHRRAERELPLEPYPAAGQQGQRQNGLDDEAGDRAGRHRAPPQPAEVEAEQPGELDVTHAEAAGRDEGQHEVGGE